ncbi:MAG: hypothetical protein M1829_003071 [Trizodia sp. TS-e1964]|nr:MAG: hypothetical protein M1829_003071 [Trizodia sp. TS-e1964]
MKIIQYINPDGQPFFTSTDVWEAGGCTIPNPTFDALTNPIHPLWQFKRWRGIRPKMYRRLAPVLRLASRLLLCPASLQYLDAIAIASECAGRDCNPVDLPHRFTAWPRDLTPKRRNRVKQFWAMLAHDPNNYTLTFAVLHSIDPAALGATIPSQSVSSSAGPGPAAEVWIDNNYTMLALENTDGFGDSKKCRRLRAQLLLANTLVHEMMHVAGLALNSKFDPYVLQEPCWQDDQAAELGYAWERQVFGSSFYELISTHNKTLGCHGLYFNSESPHVLTQKGLSTYHIIPMSFVQALQTDKFWEIDPFNAKIPLGEVFRTYNDGILVDGGYLIEPE